MNGFEGGDPNIRSGLAGASKRIVTIFMWAVVAATVGLILQILSSQARERGGIMGIVGQIIISLIGAAWSLITFFVVPLIVIEHRGLIDSLKTSLSLLRRTWGEQVVGNFGLGIMQLLASLLVLGIAALLFLVLSLFGTAGIVAAIVIGVLLFAGVQLVFATLSGNLQGRSVQLRSRRTGSDAVPGRHDPRRVPAKARRRDRTGERDDGLSIYRRGGGSPR